MSKNNKIKDKKLPRYKRRIRLLCWKMSKLMKLNNKVAVANEWALRNPKRFMGTTVAILSICFLSTIVSLIVSFMSGKEHTEAAVSNENSSESLYQGVADPQVMKNISGLHELDANREVIKQETKNLTEKGLVVKRELDSLMALPVKTSSDSIRIVQDYERLKDIVEFLNNKR